MQSSRQNEKFSRGNIQNSTAEVDFLREIAKHIPRDIPLFQHGRGQRFKTRRPIRRYCVSLETDLLA